MRLRPAKSLLERIKRTGPGLRNSGPLVYAQPTGAGTNEDGYAEGNSFPGSPSSGDKFYRTDLNLLCFYDGTRWLTVQQYHIYLALWATTVAGTTGLTGTTANALCGVIPRNSTYDFYAETWDCTTNVAGTNTGAIFWTLALRKISTAASSSIVTFNTTADTASTYTKHSTTINALLGQSHTHLVVDATETGSAGNLFLPANSVVNGRLVIT